MSEEAPSGTKFICVCAGCGHHESENPILEFNFRNKKIYQVCPKCKFHNTMDMSTPMRPKLPKTRTMR
jgi:hypothetical protein